jgi:ATP-dependent RNA helicase DDX35
MRCIATGFFANVAQRQMDGSYRGIRSQEILHLHPHSILTVTVPEWVMYGEVKYITVQIVVKTKGTSP